MQQVKKGHWNDEVNAIVNEAKTEPKHTCCKTILCQKSARIFSEMSDLVHWTSSSKCKQVEYTENNRQQTI